MTARMALLGAALCCSACGGTSPTAPTATTVTLTTEVFSGTLAVGTARFYSYEVGQGGGTVTAMLASLTPTPTTSAPDTAVAVSLGTPAGTGCAPRETVVTTPSLVPQLTESLFEGRYCVSITDIGQLARDTGFAIRIVHP